MSLLPGYEYDIFISYRHNDNLNGWVTDFVQNLEKELRSTLKDTVTIYFDRNPHDGLLETHNVDKSLEGKLKCLIFIPIISQTYCDPKSFAWQHEFCAFNKLAKEDAFGRDVRVSGGNVTSRILPVKIHDIDTEDKALLENELGGVLRAIEFIFKSPGVNRPLTSSDNPDKNQNKTFYRDQVNKTANTVKDIVTSLKNPVNPSVPTAKAQQYTPKTKSLSTRTISFLAIGVMVFMALAYTVSQFTGSSHKEPEIIDKSIAVLPFVDLSESKDQSWFGDGLTEEILNSLAHINGLRVTSRTSSFAFKDKNLRIQTIADSLGVNYVVEGSVRKSGDGLRITAQLIRAKDGFHIWSNTYDRESKDIFDLQKEIASKIAESLDISLDAKALEQMQWAGTTSAEAYLSFLKGRNQDHKAHNSSRFIDLATLKISNSYYEQSIQLDPDFVNPYLYHADFFLHYILRDDPHYTDTLTDQEAYERFMMDLTNTITRSKEVSRADYYRIPKVMYSNDWTEFRRVIEKCLYREDAVVNFKYQNFDLSSMLITLGYADRVSEISREIMDKDPTDLETFQNFIQTLMHQKKYQEVIDWISKTNLDAGTFGLKNYYYFAMINLGKPDEALSLILQDPNQDYYAYYDLKALILAGQGKYKEADGMLKMEHRSSPFYLFAVDAVHGRKAANEEASRMDKKILLDFPLFRSYSLSPDRLPFDLEATPKFNRLLRQAGPMIPRSQQ